MCNCLKDGEFKLFETDKGDDIYLDLKTIFSYYLLSIAFISGVLSSTRNSVQTKDLIYFSPP